MVRQKKKRLLLIWIMILFAASILNAAVISGTVTCSENSTPIDDCYLALYSAAPGNHHFEAVRNAVSNDEGGFCLNDIAPGNYFLYAFAEGFWEGFYANSENGQIRVVAVDADDQEVAGVDIQLFIHNDPPPPPPNSGDIAGTVRSNDNSPLPFALVGVSTLENPDHPINGIYSRTNHQGQYWLHHVPVGTYTTCLVNEYNMLAVAHSAAVNVTDNNLVQNVDIYYNAGTSYSISGSVRNSANQIVHDGIVELRSVENTGGGNIHLHQTAHLNFEGFYTFPNVPAGEYRLSIWSYASPTVYYPSALNPQQAETVTIQSNSLTDINFTIPLNLAYHIRGTVRDADTNQPLSGITVRTDRMGFHHFPVQDTLFTDAYYATTDETGYYDIAAPQGRYSVVAQDSSSQYFTQFYDHTSNPYAARIIMLWSDEENVNFDLEFNPNANLGSISGFVYDNGTVPTYPVMVVAVSSDEDWEDSALVGLDGSYQIQSLPNGRYYLIAFSLYNPPSYYDGTITWEDAEQVDVTGTMNGIDFNLIYQELDGPGNLSGVIADETGLGIGNVVVALKNASNQVIGFARTDETGNYNICNIPSQDYTLIATRLGLHSIAQDISIDGDVEHDISMVQTGVEENNISATAVPIIKAYPNPFNPLSNIDITLPKSTRLSVKIYNLKGQCIKNLYQQHTAHSHINLTWNGLADDGAQVANGIYLLKVKTDDSQSSYKVTILK